MDWVFSPVDHKKLAPSLIDKVTSSPKQIVGPELTERTGVWDKLTLNGREVLSQPYSLV
jgi:hypothetical protein